MQVRADALDEHGPHRIVELGQAGRLDVGAHGVAHGDELVGRVEVGHLARGEHPVDILEEGVVGHLQMNS